MAKDYFSTGGNKKNFIIFAGVLLLVISLGVAVYFVQKEGIFETRQYASEFNADGTPVSYIGVDGIGGTVLDDEGNPAVLDNVNDPSTTDENDDLTVIDNDGDSTDNSSDIDTDGTPTYIDSDSDGTPVTNDADDGEENEGEDYDDLPQYIIDDPIISNISEEDFTLVTDLDGDTEEDDVTVSEESSDTVSSTVSIALNLEVLDDDSSSVSVSIYEPGNEIAVLSESVTSNSDGNFSDIDISNLDSGAYLLVVKPSYYLSQSVEISLTSGDNLSITFEDEFKAGDVYEDNVINAKDVSFLNKYYFQENEEYDLTGDSMINAKDMTVLIRNWFQVGS